MRRRLLGALLAEALAPDEERELNPPRGVAGTPMASGDGRLCLMAFRIAAFAATLGTTAAAKALGHL